MKDLDIFENGRAQSGKWFYHKELGDNIQGTYIDVREGVDSYGNLQFIYVLKDKDGEVWNIGVRKTNTILNDRMKGIRLGQIVGFRLDEFRDSKKVPGGKTKIIRIYEDPKFVDQEWLDERTRLEALYGSDNASKAPTTDAIIATNEVTIPPAPDSGEVTPPTEAKPIEASVPKDKDVTPEKDEKVSDSQQAIRNLAIAKGLTNVGMSAEEEDKMIVEYTGFPLTEENTAQVIIKLTEVKIK